MKQIDIQGNSKPTGQTKAKAFNTEFTVYQIENIITISRIE